jgi:hypothetical protein
MMRLLSVMFLAATVAIPKTCTIGTGGSGSGSNGGSGYLGVPFFLQQCSLCCGQASIQGWAAYDGNFPNQQQIGSYIGATPSQGASQAQILQGVLHFTANRDANLTYFDGGLFYSQEITSINGRVPVLVFVEGALHSGIIDGGSWSYDDNSGYYVWDTVQFNDPFYGPDQTYVAASWTGTDNTQHIISASATASAQDNYNTYGGAVRLRGASGHQPLPY